MKLKNRNERFNRKQNKKRGTFFMGMGLLLTAAALLLTGYNLWDEYRAGQSSQNVLEQIAREIPEAPSRYPELEADLDEIEIPDYILDPNQEMAAVKIDGEEYIGILEIPELGLSLPIMGTWSYPKLKKAPCRYTGSAYTEDLVIAGHNYRTHFSGLKKLSRGDEIRFTDADGNQFFYEVAALEVLPPTAVEEMTESGWALSLFTCTYGGETRFTVRCESVPDVPGNEIEP